LEFNNEDKYCLGRIKEINNTRETQEKNKQCYDDLVLQGTQHIKNEDFFSAEKCLRDAINCCPYENEAKNGLDGISFKLMELNNEYISCLKNGKRSYENSEYNKALSYFQKAHVIKPQEKELNGFIKECNIKIKFSDIQKLQPQEPTDSWGFKPKTKGSKKRTAIQKTSKNPDDPFDFGKPDKKNLRIRSMKMTLLGTLKKTNNIKIAKRTIKILIFKFIITNK
jgi:tetratricopeptide (TPR) repeat protein